ncbi:MAG: oxygen-independent coproporphyrinogen III oxidase [Magnetococcales bacterium]|nr:oxygen-independent coproporphyrinogen III oxidase [Magnetococcales bacterium]
MTNLTTPSPSVAVNRELIAKYDVSGPRYTSYPTAPNFCEPFSADEMEREVAAIRAESPQRPVSLYLHVPFCDTVCFYCACNKLVTKDRNQAAIYLELLFQEIEAVGRLVTRARPVKQIHLGGGTPTFLSLEQLEALFTKLRQCFFVMEDGSGEYGIEIDPREAPPGSITRLGNMGFNRISFGVQDTNPLVQKVVNRIQPMDLNRQVVEEARSAGFHSINLDLIYGLPLQTRESFGNSLIEVLDTLDPDRLAIFNYAHLPHYFTPQRRIHAEDLPSAAEKLAIMEATIRLLLQRGYVYIGMDHFAKPDNELAIAQAEGTLHRNFQGYTTHAQCDLFGLGVSSISQVGEVFTQNQKTLESYRDAILQGRSPIFRGLRRNRDDQIRHAVITRLICRFALDFAEIATLFAIDFEEYFNNELLALQPLAADGLIDMGHRSISVTPVGKLMIRNICMIFDRYLTSNTTKKSFSKTL